jgi:hypothetical protein
MGTSFMSEPTDQKHPSAASGFSVRDSTVVNHDMLGKIAKGLYLYVIIWPGIAMLCWRFDLFTSLFDEFPYLLHVTGLIACAAASFVLPIPLWKRFLFFILVTVVGLFAAGVWFVLGTILFGGIG